MVKILSAIMVSMLALAVLGGCAGGATPAAGGTNTTTPAGANGDPQSNAGDLQANIFRDVTANEAKSLTNDNSNMTIIDVRTTEEYAGGHLAKAFNIDVNGADFRQKIAALDKDAPYLIYCRSGKRSQDAVNIMKEMGFSNVSNMLGGITQWIADGGNSCMNC